MTQNWKSKNHKHILVRNFLLTALTAHSEFGVLLIETPGIIVTLDLQPTTIENYIMHRASVNNQEQRK